MVQLIEIQSEVIDLLEKGQLPTKKTKDATKFFELVLAWITETDTLKKRKVFEEIYGKFKLRTGHADYTKSRKALWDAVHAVEAAYKAYQAKIDAEKEAIAETERFNKSMAAIKQTALKDSSNRLKRELNRDKELAMEILSPSYILDFFPSYSF